MERRGKQATHLTAVQFPLDTEKLNIFSTFELLSKINQTSKIVFKFYIYFKFFPVKGYSVDRITVTFNIEDSS